MIAFDKGTSIPALPSVNTRLKSQGSTCVCATGKIRVYIENTDRVYKTLEK